MKTCISGLKTRRGRSWIDVLVNNFGSSNPKKDLGIANTDPEVFIKTVNINLKSVFIASQTAVKYMAEHGGGSSCILRKRRRRIHHGPDPYYIWRFRIGYADIRRSV